MGLLDDAIREHLELRRLRGADPGAVAQQERDALGSVRQDDGAQEESDEALPDVDRSISSDVGAPSGDLLTAGQETIEINMEDELAGTQTDLGHDQEAVPSRRAAAVAPLAGTPTSVEDSLEWEVPSDRLEETRPGAGSGDEAGPLAADDEHLEDVLEETPDFLRDTPEQERLWFEQRPPRDFDFNE